jgi:hypothetical protein
VNCSLFFIEDGVPRGELVLFFFKEGVGGIEDFDLSDGIAGGDGIDDVLALSDFTEDAVFAVEPGGGFVSDEELGAVGAGAGVGHGEDSGLGVFEGGIEFIAELVAGIAGAGAEGAAALDHEIGNDAVELEAIVVTAFGEISEVGDGHGALAGEEGAFDVALGRFDDDADVFDLFRLSGEGGGDGGDEGGEEDGDEFFHDE